MKNIFLFLLILFLSSTANTQVPINKIWDFRYGGSSTEDPRKLLLTLDGGYLVCGWSLSSISFDKTDNTRSLGAADYWVVKTDSSGNLLWENTFGGDLYDSLTCAIALPDSGYLIGGYSRSNISGEKTQPNWDVLNHSNDYWIIRIDKNGNIIWDKRFGGVKDEQLHSLLLLPDGNYLLGGFTRSDSTGDMSHHTFNDSINHVFRAADYWIVKVDMNGNKLWDKNYGGSKSDELISLGLTSDHGFILAGKSSSPISGTKSQPAYNNGYDFWIVKTDSNGVQLWDKTIGSGGNDNMSCFKLTPFDNIIIGGITNAGVGFDKTDPGYGSEDFWFVYTSPMGVKIWDNAYGGNQKEDDVNGVAITTNGFVITGASYSNISGDKSENNILSNEQAWMIAVDNLGNKLWDKTFNTDTHVEFATGLQTPDGCYTILSHVNKDGGDVSQVRNSEFDYWLGKFCPSPLPSANFIASANSTCQNTCVNFTNLTLNATSYNWFFPGGTPSFSTSANPQGICYFNIGNFDVILIATNAIGTDTVTYTNFISVHPPITFSPLIQGGDTLFSVPGFVSYEWYFGSTLISGAYNYFHVAQQSGNYTVIVTDSNGCDAVATLLKVTVSVNNILSSEENNLLVSYNNENIFINVNSSITALSSLEVTDAVGKTIYNDKIFLQKGKNDFTFPLNNISKGIYFVRIKNNQMEKIQKFISN